MKNIKLVLVISLILTTFAKKEENAAGNLYLSR